MDLSIDGSQPIHNKAERHRELCVENACDLYFGNSFLWNGLFDAVYVQKPLHRALGRIGYRRKIDRKRGTPQFYAGIGVNEKMGHLLGLFKGRKEIPSKYEGWRLLFHTRLCRKKGEYGWRERFF